MEIRAADQLDGRVSISESFKVRVEKPGISGSPNVRVIPQWACGRCHLFESMGKAVAPVDPQPSAILCQVCSLLQPVEIATPCRFASCDRTSARGGSVQQHTVRRAASATPTKDARKGADKNLSGCLRINTAIQHGPAGIERKVAGGIRSGLASPSGSGKRSECRDLEIPYRGSSASPFRLPDCH